MVTQWEATDIPLGIMQGQAMATPPCNLLIALAILAPVGITRTTMAITVAARAVLLLAGEDDHLHIVAVDATMIVITMIDPPYIINIVPLETRS